MVPTLLLLVVGALLETLLLPLLLLVVPGMTMSLLVLKSQLATGLTRRPLPLSGRHLS